MSKKPPIYSKLFNKIKVPTINSVDYDKNMKKSIYKIFDI